MKAKILFLLFSIFSFSAFATHMRSGEITYKCLGGYTYQITLTTYTRGSSSSADRCYEQINFGDDTTYSSVCRCNYESGDPTTDPWGASCTGNPNCTTHHMGEWSMFPLCLDIKKNIYCANHTFSGPGNYVISFLEPNRMNGIVNIPNNTPLYIADTLNISPFITCVSSPVFINPIPDTAHVGFCYTYNQSAIDPDSDSLSYKLISCMDSAGYSITGYVLPSGATVDSITGNFTWCSPPVNATYPAPWNFAINIEKWRKIGSNYFVAGTVMREIQILVEACAAMTVNDINSELPNINIFPNPTNGKFTIKNEKEKITELNIYNMFGEIIYQSANAQVNQSTNVDLSSTPAGIYFLQVKTGNGVVVKKVVKE